MSDNNEIETVEAEPLPHDRADGDSELDTRTVFGILFNDPAVRNFTFSALGALGMIFLILFEQGSDIGAVLIVILGACGLFLRWPASPAFVLLVLFYFMIFPYGVPSAGYEDSFLIDEDRFRVTHILLVMSVLVYLSCQYRILGFVHQAVAFDGQVRRRDERPARRPAALIRPAELGILFGTCAALVVVGQLLWWFANNVEIVPYEDFPLKLAKPGRTTNEHAFASSTDSRPPGYIRTGLTRFIVLVGFLFFGMLIARLAFGYWRLRMMGSAEGRMILLDGSWSETSRDRQRIEKWRIWGRNRAQADAKLRDRVQIKETS
jgi:hypothetical protein